MWLKKTSNVFMLLLNFVCYGLNYLKMVLRFTLYKATIIEYIQETEQRT